MGCMGSRNTLPMQLYTEREDIYAKLVFCGQYGVGKSSIRSTYQTGQYHNRHMSYFQRRLVSKTGIGLRLTVWDTAGSERYISLMPLYLRDVSIMMLVFDLTDHHSFVKLDFFIQQYNEYIQINKVLICLVGNKLDLFEQRKGFREEGEKKAKELPNCFYHQTSALTAQGVTELFQKATDHFVQLVNNRKQQD